MKPCLLAALLCLSTLALSQTVVERHGALSVAGNQILDECGRPTQLKGMSYFWSQFQGGEYWTREAVKWLADDWRITLLRAPVGVGYGTDYRADTAAAMAQLRPVIEGAIDAGIYVLVDWHAHANFRDDARTFFRTIAREYGQYPNVIYELWNEPIGEQTAGAETWREIKSYAEDLTAVIRQHDPDNLIVVGTPFYSQLVDEAAADPIIRDSLGQPTQNIVYTLHFYAGAHRDSLRDGATRAYESGLPLMVTESGRVGTNYGPDNTLDPAEWDRWEAWMDERHISYTKWSLSTKLERSSSLRNSASPTGGWTENDLTPEGQWNRAHFRRVNADLPPPCE